MERGSGEKNKKNTTTPQKKHLSSFSSVSLIILLLERGNRNKTQMSPAKVVEIEMRLRTHCTERDVDE